MLITSDKAIQCIRCGKTAKRTEKRQKYCPECAKKAAKERDEAKTWARKKEEKMNLIAIVDVNWGIARDGAQICTIPDDLKRFRELTMGGTVVMGRKTYEAIGRALPGRKNIVISKTLKSGESCTVYPALLVLLDLWPFFGDLWVIGGESIYRQLLPYCDRAYITLVYADFLADQFIEDLSQSGRWELTGTSKIMNHDGMVYQFLEYRAIQPPTKRGD